MKIEKEFSHTVWMQQIQSIYIWKKRRKLKLITNRCNQSSKNLLNQATVMLALVLGGEL